MHRFFLLLLVVLGACGDEVSSDEVNNSDSTEGPEIIIVNDSSETTDMSDDFTANEGYDMAEDEPANSSGPEGLAEQMAPHAVQLVYIESPLRLSTKVLNESTAADGRKELKVKYRWYDRWSSRPYELIGRLLVNSDGSDADFKVLSRNAELEAYAMVEEKTGTQKHVDQL